MRLAIGFELRNVGARAGLLVAGFIVLLGIELLVVSITARQFFVAAWEILVIPRLASPMAIALLLPIALVLGAVVRVLEASRARKALPALFSVAAAGLMFLLTTSHRFDRLVIRAPVVLGFGVVVFAASWWLLPRIERLSRRGRRALSVLVVALAWSADAFVLVRLYPAFHHALFAIVLASITLFVGTIPSTKKTHVFAGASLVVASMACVWTARARVRLYDYDNVVMLLGERAPIHGRAVAIGVLDRGPEDISGPTELAPDKRVRSVDWSGHDILLISIDALRADHVSAYGYSRRTTPNIDALASAGVRFNHAYCPTPHTSYSITSMMTGKYMRPLLLMNLGRDSETWPVMLRRYDYKTAAFYPPAVFFIDEDKFRAFSENGLGFEYRKVEFADAELRIQQIEHYLATAAPSPLFLWVHLFEPHEPYVAHPGFSYEGGHDIDAYDGEVAYTDAAVGRIRDLMQTRKRPLVIVLTADHGEEFGDHGGRYHGTTVYEEQVRVPLIIVAPGLRPRVVDAPVQTIDLLSTVLSALDVPDPPRLRGRDLGALMTGTAKADDHGFAFAETHDMAMLADGSSRLVCQRRLSSCTLYDIASDPKEEHDIGASQAPRLAAMKRKLAQIERSHGTFERPGSEWPEALRRGIAGDREAAVEVASLLEDASAVIRKKAAEISFALHEPSAAPTVKRAALRESDPRTRTLSLLALVRMGEEPTDAARTALTDADPSIRARAALVLAERGDAAGGRELANTIRGCAADFEECVQYIDAAGIAKARDVVPALTPLLADVRLRGYAASALGAIGDASSVPPLLAAFRTERYQTAREREAAALAKLGAGEEMFPTLRFFASVPEPLYGALAIAHGQNLLRPNRGGVSFRDGSDGGAERTAELTVEARELRVLVLEESEGAAPRLSIDEHEVSLNSRENGVYESRLTAETTRLTIRASGAAAVWLLTLVDDLLPPPKRAWKDGGVDAQPEAPHEASGERKVH